MATSGRIENQKKEHNSVLKDFFQDQFGILVIVLGSIPIFLDYGETIYIPSWFEESTKAINLIIPIISSITIIYIYTKRKTFTRERKPFISIISTSFIIVGLVLFTGLAFIGRFFENIENTKKNIEPGFEFTPQSFYLFIIISFLILPIFLKWIYEVMYESSNIEYQKLLETNFLITSNKNGIKHLQEEINKIINQQQDSGKNKSQNSDDSKSVMSDENKTLELKKFIAYSSPYFVLIALICTFYFSEKFVPTNYKTLVLTCLVLFYIPIIKYVIQLNTNFYKIFLSVLSLFVNILPRLLYPLTIIFYQLYRALIFISKSIIILLITGLITYIILKKPEYFGIIESNKLYIIPFKNLEVYYSLLYILYSPFLIVGLALSLILLFVTYSEQRNFYENINLLGDEFYTIIEKITKSIADFEQWNIDERSKIDNAIINSYVGKSQLSSTTLSDIERPRQIFYRLAMLNKLKIYGEYIANLSVQKYPELYASGKEIDEIYESINKIPNKGLKSFKAVSHDDFPFWKHRGQEYLNLNKEQVNNGILVKRIFIYDNNEDLGIRNKATSANRTEKNTPENHEIEFESMLEIIFSQIQMGIVVYLIDKKKIETNTHSILDFGVYDNFAVSNFDRQYKIGGRGLKMEFNNNTITELSEYFDSLISKAAVSDSFSDKIDNIIKDSTIGLKSSDIIRNYSAYYYENVCVSPLQEINLDKDIESAEIRRLTLLESKFSLNINLRILLFLEFLQSIVLHEDQKSEYTLKMKVAYEKWKKIFYNDFRKTERDSLFKQNDVVAYKNIIADYENSEILRLINLDIEQLSQTNNNGQDSSNSYENYIHLLKIIEDKLWSSATNENSDNS